MGMVQIVILAVVICVGIHLIRTALGRTTGASRREALFSIRFEDGQPAEESGCLPEGLRRDLHRVGRDFRVSGRVDYYPDEGVDSESDLDDGELQRFRNVIAMHMRRPSAPS